MKVVFLKRHYMNTRNTFSWPNKRTIECVPIACIFYGPITLQGAGPFVVPDFTQIENKFGEIKKSI